MTKFPKKTNYKEIEKIAQQNVQKPDEPINLEKFQQQTDLSKAKLTTVISSLEEVGEVELLPTGEVVGNEDSSNLKEVALKAVDAQKCYQSYLRSRLEMMQNYASLKDCCRKYLLNYFGKNLEKPYVFCDNCKAESIAEINSKNQTFSLNSSVIHPTWGQGLVLHYEGDKMVVLFDEVGYQTLAVDLVKQRELLFEDE